MLRNLTIASNGRIYVLAIYDMCRTDLRGADGLSAGVDRAQKKAKKINYYDLKGNTVKGKVDSISNMLPLAFAEFDKAVTQDSIVLFPRVWENFRGDTGRVAKTNETDPFYITWYPDHDKRKTFHDKPVSSANAEESKDTENDRPDPVLTMADLNKITDPELKLKYIELGPFVFKTVHDGRKRTLKRRVTDKGNILINEITEDGRANGKGIKLQLTPGNNSLSEGYWKNNQNIYARTIYAGGNYYIGDLKTMNQGSLKHGYGEYYWPDGESYRGQYRANIIHGKGIATSAKG